MAEVLLTGGVHADGSHAPVAIRDGVVVAGVGPHAETTDLDGRLLLPAMAEPHAHLDKAFLADRLPNPRGDLMTAIEIMQREWPRIDPADVSARAERAARRLLMAGTTAIRTHADLWVDSGDTSVVALIGVRDRLAHLLDISVVGLAGPLVGPDGPAGCRLLEAAADAGIDVIGSCPHIEDDPVASIERTLEIAVENGLPADLHFDEVLDESVQHLEDLARAVDRFGLGGRVTASHCVSHGLLDPERQREVARALAAAGVAVITNPRTNLFLQGRGTERATPRGMVGIQALIDERVTVAAGADNLQDPFYIVGRSDPLETASLLVAAAHRTVSEAWAMVSSDARRVIGATRTGTRPGDTADLVAVRASTLREAVADQPADRIVFRGGRIVARTTVDEWVSP